MAKLSWTVKFKVDESWVRDGFDLDDEQVKEMIAHRLPYAYSHELEGKVIARPSKRQIKQAMADIPITQPEKADKPA